MLIGLGAGLGVRVPVMVGIGEAESMTGSENTGACRHRSLKILLGMGGGVHIGVA